MPRRQQFRKREQGRLPAGNRPCFVIPVSSDVAVIQNEVLRGTHAMDETIAKSEARIARYGFFLNTAYVVSGTSNHPSELISNSKQA
jgi:hypothetical protein